MSQLDGTITVDEGYRVGTPGSSSPAAPERSFDPADHADESLGVSVYGAEAWSFPGMSDPHSDCGNYRVEGVCENCGEPHFAPHQCGRRGCPNCAGIWMKQAAMKRTVRLQSVRYTAGFKQVAHAVVSPDELPQTTREYLDGRSEAAEVAKEKGFTDFDVIAHPCRVTDEGKEIYENEQDEDDRRGIHVWLKHEYPERYTFGADDSLLYWSPHYHIIGRTSANMEPGRESDPYVYTFIDSLPAFGMNDKQSYEAVYRVYRYLLSHAGIHEERQFQAVVGYGGLSNTAYKDHKPSDGAISRMERIVEEVAEEMLDDDGGSIERASSEDDELGDCSKCDDGRVINVFRAPDYIEQAQPPPDIRDRLITAYEWRKGDIQPPPGLKRPQSEEQAREAFESLV